MVPPDPYKLDLKNRLKAKGGEEGGNLKPLAFCHLNLNYLKWRLYFSSFVQMLVPGCQVQACPPQLYRDRRGSQFPDEIGINGSANNH